MKDTLSEKRLRARGFDACMIDRADGKMSLEKWLSAQHTHFILQKLRWHVDLYRVAGSSWTRKLTVG
jgi:hypothetical protein